MAHRSCGSAPLVRCKTCERDYTVRSNAVQPSGECAFCLKVAPTKTTRKARKGQLSLVG